MKKIKDLLLENSIKILKTQERLKEKIIKNLFSGISLASKSSQSAQKA